MPNRPWLAHYEAGIPPSLEPYPGGTALDMLARHVRDRPDAPALRFKGRSVTWRELDVASGRFGAGLAARGVRKGDRVAVILPNCPQFLVAQYGIWKAGGVVVALNPTYTEREFESPLRDSGARLAVVLSRAYGRIKAVQPRTALERLVASNIKEYLPRHLALLFTLFKEKKEGHRVTLAAGDEWFLDVLRSGEGAAPPSVPLDPEDEAVILASGGTTGTPKGVVGLHKAYVRSGVQIRTWVASLLQGASEPIMLPLPLFHVYANVGVQTMALTSGNPLVLVPNPRDLDDVLRTIERERPVFFTGVPTLFNALLNHPRVAAGRADFSSIKLCFSGAAPLLAETRRRFESLTGGTICEGYSLTEGMMATVLNPVRGRAKTGSIGVPLPDVDVRIVDSETGERELGPGETGEVILRADQMMREYWRNPGETLQTLRTRPDGTVWLHTGDIGHMDEEGYIFLTDRKKDLIKTSGYQVWPREIEEVLAAHPAVKEVGVAGVPDQAKGEIVKAWVVLREGASVTPEELRAHCRQKLAPYKVPGAVEFRDELPKTMVGKVLRRALKEPRA